MKILTITYYEDNDIQLKNNEYWINKNNVNLFIDNEPIKSFSDSLYGAINFKTCMDYIQKEYPSAELVNAGCYFTGWNYMNFKVEE